MANETATLEQATDKMADSLFSDELYSAPKADLGIQVADRMEVPVGDEPIGKTLEVTTPEAPKEQPKVPDFDVNKYVKENFGFDDEATAKQQLEKWRKAESEPKPKVEPEKPQFANEESETLYNAFVTGDKKKVTELLKKQDQIDEAANLSPLEQIKLDLQYKNNKYTKEDIQDIIEEKYSYPRKPIQRDDELDSEFQEREQSYQNDVAKIDRRIKRDGLEAVENLQKQKTDLVLPDINGQRANYENWLQQQKELQEYEANAHTSYLTALEKDSGFDGFKTTYKDKEVEVPIEFKPTDEEKKEITSRFKNGFDADEYFAKRWFKEENDKVVGFNIATQKEDIYLLENKQKIFDKIAQDSAARALAAYLKGERNISPDFPNGKQVQATNIQKAIDEKLTDKLWGDR